MNDQFFKEINQLFLFFEIILKPLSHQAINYYEIYLKIAGDNLLVLNVLSSQNLIKLLNGSV